MKHLTSLLFVLAWACAAWAQVAAPTTAPTTRPAIPDVDAMMRSLLVPERPRAMPIPPAPDPPPISSIDRPIKPNPPPQNLVREGTIRFDRLGRLTRNADGQQEVTFDGDGQTLSDPPMIVLPNRKLMDMENLIKSTGAEQKFKITGMVTEYNGRNYILLDKAQAVSSDRPSF
jgi:hypothetical protein